MPEDLTRRALLGRTLGGVVVGGVALAGCSVDLPGSSSTGDSAAEADPDEALVAEVTARIEQAESLLRRTTEKHRELTARLQPLIDLHATHLQRLRRSSASPAPSPTPTPLTVAPRPAAARATALATEAQLHTDLAGFAQRARSGLLARLFASMSAAISQELA